MIESHGSSTALRTDDQTQPREPLEQAVVHRGYAKGVFLFVRHVLEMLVAMWIGMALGGVLVEGILAAIGTTANEAQLRYPELAVVVMGLNMTVPTVVWMRHRGHGWRSCAEMAGAMLLPAIPSILLLRAHLTVPGATCALYSTWMTVAMLALMLYRREEYGAPPKRQSEKTVQSAELDLTRARSGS